MEHSTHFCKRSNNYVVLPKLLWTVILHIDRYLKYTVLKKLSNLKHLQDEEVFDCMNEGRPSLASIWALNFEGESTTAAFQITLEDRFLSIGYRLAVFFFFRASYPVKTSLKLRLSLQFNFNRWYKLVSLPDFFIELKAMM